MIGAPFMNPFIVNNPGLRVSRFFARQGYFLGECRDHFSSTRPKARTCEW